MTQDEWLVDFFTKEQSLSMTSNEFGTNVLSFNRAEIIINLLQAEPPD